jgi:hypothetical protein
LRGSTSSWTWARHQIGFVLPKSTKPGRSGDRDPRIARPAEIGFVLPKSAQPGGGRDGNPGVAAPWRRSRDLQFIECLDRRLSPRQRAPLVAIEPHQPGGDVAGGGKAFHHDLVAQAADALDVDLRVGDAERGFTARLARALPGDPLRQRGNLRREHRVGQHRQAQPMAQRVVLDRGLADARARAGAARRIGAIGGEDGSTGHAGSPSDTSAGTPSSTGGGAIKSRRLSM